MTAHTTSGAPHAGLAPLPGSEHGWRVWRWVLLRSAGFPVAGLDRLAAPDCARAADALLAAGTGPGRAAAAAGYEQALAAAGARLAREVHDIARDPAFRTALTWQNPDLLDTVRRVLRAGPEPARSKNQRHREEAVAKYWQRYCGKNDSAGFFGPTAWTPLDPGAPAVAGGPGPHLVRDRYVHFEWWALDALADALAADERVRPWLPLVLGPHLELRGRALHRPGSPPVPLTAAEAALLARADGSTAARRIAAELAADPEPGFHTPADVLLLAENLIERGWLTWGQDLPFHLGAERALRACLESIDDAEVRALALAPLDRLCARRDAVAAAASPEDLAACLTALDEAFTEATGRSARRRAGLMYAGRTPCHLDAARDVQLTLGQAVLDKLAPLEPLLESARWLTARLAAGYGAILTELYRDLVAEHGTASVPFDELWYLAQGVLFGADRPADPVIADFVARWRTALGLEGAADLDARTVSVPADELAKAVADLFPAERPGWTVARIHAPDLHLCAPDLAAAARGEFTVVLGELHIGAPALDTDFFRLSHPRPAELAEAAARDFAAPRLRPAIPDDWPRLTARNAEWMLGPEDAAFGFAPGTGVDRARLLPATCLRVEPGRTRGGDGADGADGADLPGEALVVRAPDGRAWPLIEPVAELVGMHAIDAWKLVGAAGGHSPRVDVDGLVVLRETWRTTAAGTGLAKPNGEHDRMLAVRAWKERLGLPDRVFVKAATETKPCYADLSSPIFARTLCSLMRAAERDGGPDAEITVTEMLPGADGSWLPDAEGRSYTSELRLHFVDAAAAPRAERTR